MTSEYLPEIEMQPLTTLYVADIDSAVNENDLRRFFREKGLLTYVKLCIDHATGQQSAFIYYNNREDAARAIADLNFTSLNGKIIRISYSTEEDSNTPRNPAANLYVKNLDRSIDQQTFYETFSSYGTIISSKVQTDALSNESKGFGFVQFYTEEAAQKAIEELNGSLLHGKKIYVGPFIKKEDRDIDPNTNLFVKNFTEKTTEEDLRMKFGEFGSIKNLVVKKDDGGKSKCFGFVTFENTESANRAIEILDGQIIDGKEWYVQKAQTRLERQEELNLKRLNNLYVKNLEWNIDSDEKLRGLFEDFGTITSCKINCNERGISIGSGFVEFSSADQASTALARMNGKKVGMKQLYVAIAENKEERREKMRLEHELRQMVLESSRPMMKPPPPSVDPIVPPRQPMFRPGFGYPPLRPPMVWPGLGYPPLRPPMVGPGLEYRPPRQVFSPSLSGILGPLPYQLSPLMQGDAYRYNFPPEYGRYNFNVSSST